MIEIVRIEDGEGGEGATYVMVRDGEPVGCLMPPQSLDDWSTRYPHRFEGYLAGRPVHADDELGMARAVEAAFPDDETSWA